MCVHECAFVRCFFFFGEIVVSAFAVLWALLCMYVRMHDVCARVLPLRDCRPMAFATQWAAASCA